MPLMEAMACGLPAIATDWGAHQEFVHAGNAYPLAVRGTVPAVAKCPYYEGFSWADPDPGHLRRLMRQVYENQEEARRRGLAAACEMAERWTWPNAARRIIEATNSVYFAGQRLANRFPIGIPETLQAANARTVRAFHTRWYRPENCIVLVVGDVEHSRLVELAKKPLKR